MELDLPTRAAKGAMAGRTGLALRDWITDIVRRMRGGQRCETCGEVAGQNETCSECQHYSTELTSW